MGEMGGYGCPGIATEARLDEELWNELDNYARM
jgi:hypothetical protein